MSYFSQHTSNQPTYQVAESKNNFDQMQPDEYFPQAVRNGTVEGVVCNIFPARAFHYADNREAFYKALMWLTRWQKILELQYIGIKSHLGTC